MTFQVPYIRDDKPSFEIPPYRGQRYEAWIPDTLDVQERAALAVKLPGHRPGLLEEL